MKGASNKFGAVAPLLGYLYQCRQALLLSIELSKSFPGLSVSIERFDDIAIENMGEPSLQLQLKHHITPGTLTDKSSDIWKTLRIWSENVETNPQLPFETRFIILTTGTAVEGSAAAALRPGRSKEDEEAALALLVTAATTSENEETKKARQAFLALSPEARRSLLAAVFVFDSAPNITNVRAEIEDVLAFAVPTQHIETLVNNLEGWWFAAVIRCLMQEDEPSLSLLSLRSKIDELAAAFKRGELLLNPDLEAALTAENLASEHRIFVQQMSCVGLGQLTFRKGRLDDKDRHAVHALFELSSHAGDGAACVVASALALRAQRSTQHSIRERKDRECKMIGLVTS